MNSNSNLLEGKNSSVSPNKQQQQQQPENKNSGKENTKYPICFHCKDRIREKQCVILGQKKYHLDHFRCSKCNQKLSNRLFYEYHNKIYCEEDYKQSIAPICHQCNNFIQGKYITAKNASFHLECFVCYKCNFAIEDKQEFFFSADKIHIYCKKCKKKNAEICVKCKKTIQENEQCLGGKYYHTECLSCQKCYTDLPQSTFVLHHNMIVHDSCVIICHHCNQKIDDERDISHYFEYILHSKCISAYASYLRQNTINAFKKQNSNQFKNQQLHHNQQQQQQQQQQQPPTSLMSPTIDYNNINQLETLFSNSLDQLNKQFQEVKISEGNFDVHIELGAIIKEKLDSSFSKSGFSMDSKISEEDISPKSQKQPTKAESLFQLPNSRDKQLCIQGANITAQKKDKKKKIEIINSESDENDSD